MRIARWDVIFRPEAWQASKAGEGGWRLGRLVKLGTGDRGRGGGMGKRRKSGWKEEERARDGW